MRQAQRADATVGPILQAKLAGEKLALSLLLKTSGDGHRLPEFWDQLILKDGLLYHQYESNHDHSAGHNWLSQKQFVSSFSRSYMEAP